jgi:hypothetical protein
MPLFNSPTIDQIGYTSARVTLPAAGDWPAGVTSADLYLREDGDVYGAALATGLIPSEVVIIDILDENTKYFIKINGEDGSAVVYESVDVEFDTLVGEAGPGVEVAIPADASYPVKPSPVTLDNPKATSVSCRHQGALPVNADTVVLKYRPFDILGATLWIDHPTTVIADTNINVSSLSEDTIYEFVFVAENSTGETWGDIARYNTNLSTDAGEEQPDAPILENRPFPDGKTIIRVTAPAPVASVTTYTLQYTTNPLGAWISVTEPVEPNGVVDVSNLTLNTRYYFRVFNGSYIGQTADIYTLSEMPDAPGLVTFGATGPSFINAILPALPANADYLKLQRGTGTIDNITWGNPWAAFGAGENFFDTLLTTDTIYWYRAIAVNEAGEVIGPISQSDTYTIIPEIPEPIIFEYVGATFSDFIIPPLPLRASRISIERGLEISSAIAEIEDRATPEATYTDTPLIPSKVYLYKVVAHNSAGSVEGCIVGIHTRLGDETTTVEAPNVVISAIGQVTVYSPTLPNWPQYVNELVLQYRDISLVQSLDSNVFGEQLFGNAIFGNTTSTDWVTLAEDVFDSDTIIINDGVDTPLVDGHTYDFRWIAKNDYTSYPSPFTTIELSVPDAPDAPVLITRIEDVENNITETPTIDSLTIRLGDIVDGVSYLILYRTKTPLDNDSWVAVTPTSGPNVIDEDDVEIVDTPLGSYTGYYYKARAVNIYGNTDSTVAGPFTTKSKGSETELPPVPGLPTVTMLDIDDITGNYQLGFEIELSENLDALTDYYKIQYKEANPDSNPWATVDFLFKENGETYTLDLSTPADPENEANMYDTDFLFRWVAYNNSGQNVTYGEPVYRRSVALPPEAPSAPTIELVL